MGGYERNVLYDISVILCLTLSTIWQWLEEGCGGRI